MDTRGLYLALLLICGAGASVGAQPPLDCREYASDVQDSEDLIVSTYHVTKVPGTFRTVTLTWPRAYRFPLSGRPIGVKEGPEQSMAFHLSLSDPSPAKTSFFTWVSKDWDKLEVSIHAVDAYPLHSRFGLIAGAPRGSQHLRERANGTTYHTSDGYVFTGHDLQDGWLGAAYPEPWNENFEDEFYWLRFDDTEEIDGILKCHPPSQRAICQAHFKQEPFFVSARFSWTQIQKLSDVERRAREFVLCIAEAGQEKTK